MISKNFYDFLVDTNDLIYLMNTFIVITEF